MKSFAIIAALGILGTPAIAASISTPTIAIAQTGSAIDSVLDAELTRVANLIAVRPLTKADFTVLRNLISERMAALTAKDPLGASFNGSVTKEADDLMAAGLDEKYKLIIDDFRTIRQSITTAHIQSRLRMLKAAVVSGQSPAGGVTPVIEVIKERRLNAISTDVRAAADEAAALALVNSLADRMKGAPVQIVPQDFDYVAEAIMGQKMISTIQVMMNREKAGRMSAINFQQIGALIIDREKAEKQQLYREAPVERTRLQQVAMEVQQSAMQAGVQVEGYEFWKAVTVDMDLRASVTHLQSKALGKGQSVVEFSRIRDLLSIRRTTSLGGSNTGRTITKGIRAEVTKLEQLAGARTLVAADFTVINRFREALLQSASEATFKK